MIKPGITTSEFWAHVIVLILAGITVVGSLFHPGFKVRSSVQTWVPVGAVLCAVISHAFYASGRAGLKKRALDLVHVLGEALPAIEGAAPPTPAGKVVTEVAQSIAGTVGQTTP